MKSATDNQLKIDCIVPRLYDEKVTLTVFITISEN